MENKSTDTVNQTAIKRPYDVLSDLSDSSSNDDDCFDDTKILNKSFRQIVKKAKSTIIPSAIRFNVLEADPLTKAIISKTCKLGAKELKLFKNVIVENIDRIVEGFVPRFRKSYVMNGLIVISCADKISLDWLSALMNNICPFPQLGMLRLINLETVQFFCFRTQVHVWIPGPCEDTANMLMRLERQNPGLCTTNWQIIDESSDERGSHLYIKMPESSFDKLEALKFRAYLGVGQIDFNKIIFHKFIKNDPED